MFLHGLILRAPMATCQKSLSARQVGFIRSRDLMRAAMFDFDPQITGMKPNERPAADARIPLLFAIGHHWRGTTEAKC